MGAGEDVAPLGRSPAPVGLWCGKGAWDGDIAQPACWGEGSQPPSAHPVPPAHRSPGTTPSIFALPRSRHNVHDPARLRHGSSLDPASHNARCKAPSSCSGSGCQGIPLPHHLGLCFMLRGAGSSRIWAGIPGRDNRSWAEPQHEALPSSGVCAQRPDLLWGPHVGNGVPKQEPGAAPTQHGPAAEATEPSARRDLYRSL